MITFKHGNKVFRLHRSCYLYCVSRTLQLFHIRSIGKRKASCLLIRMWVAWKLHSFHSQIDQLCESMRLYVRVQVWFSMQACMCKYFIKYMVGIIKTHPEKIEARWNHFGTHSLQRDISFSPIPDCPNVGSPPRYIGISISEQLTIAFEFAPSASQRCKFRWEMQDEQSKRSDQRWRTKDEGRRMKVTSHIGILLWHPMHRHPTLASYIDIPKIPWKNHRYVPK